ncbi:MAG: YkgJ family cysteine cluster protein [Cellvibrionales bacterium]|nr:YkgJ family cysteine cluster protein [Cellvibrionales bacterium]
MQCRVGCGACCIAPSINTPFYGMPSGKQSGERCVHLSDENRCCLFNDPRRPSYCAKFSADSDFCGSSFDEAMKILLVMESETS